MPSGETVTIRIPLVSMKSGLGDRNNTGGTAKYITTLLASMKSGLGDRNNLKAERAARANLEAVSMKSGLRDRNNLSRACLACHKTN